jgi:hypothetical protein
LLHNSFYFLKFVFLDEQMTIVDVHYEE